MAIYIDRSRKSEVTCSIATDLRVFVFPNDVPIPDELDQYGPLGSTTFGSNQQSATVTIVGVGGSSSLGSSSWTWQVNAVCVCNNGFGTSTTTTLVLQSGTGTAAQASVGISVNIGATLIEWTGTVDQSTVYWDIVQSAFGGVGSEYPDVTYTSYETSNIGGTATAKVIVNGLTASASGVISTASNMSWDLRLGLRMYNNTSSTRTLVVSPGLMNLVSLVSSVPSYSHVYRSQSATAVQYNVTGVGNIYPGSFIEGSTNITLRRLVRIKGRINAFDLSYPDPLDVRITGYDRATVGYRDISVPSGSFQEDDAFQVSSVNTVITNYDIATGTTTNSKSASVNTVPPTMSVDIKSASLSSLGDDSTNTKMLFRGWSFPGCDVSQAKETNISIGVTSANRSFASPGVGLNSYRYLEAEIRSITGTTQSGTIAITTQPGSVIKSFPVSVTSSTFTKTKIDLCSPSSASTSIDETDHPYPRFNVSDPTNAAQSIDGDYFGITRSTQISLIAPNIEMRDVKIVLGDPTGEYAKGYWLPTRTWYKPQTTPFGGQTWNVNRLFQAITEGNSQTEEPWALWTSSPAANTLLTINDFVGYMNATDGTVKRHQGYSSSSSTPNTSAGYIRNGFANSFTGHAYWLGGTTFRRVGGSAEIRTWANVNQTAGSPDTTVYAQTYFRSINGNYVPDVLDVFEQDDAGALWLSMGCVSYQRGRSFGLVLQNNASPLSGETVSLNLDSTGALRGTGVSDLIGRYQTGLPMGLGLQNHNTIALGLNSGDPDPMFTDKQYRFVFKQPATSGTVISADRDAILRHYYATINSGVISVWKANGPLGTDYVETITSISGASDAYLRCLKADVLVGLVLFVRKTTGSLERYYTSDGGSTLSVATTINSTGTHPAMCIDAIGREIYIWRSSSGSIESKILDSAGTILMPTTTVVASSVADTSIDIYERLDDLYIVYNNTSTGITVVRSTDGGRTYV